MDEPFDRQTLILSAAQPGLGQLASGRSERGLILLALSLVFGILGGVDGTLLKLLTGGRRPLRVLPDRLNPLALIWAGIYAYNLYDAYNIAAGLDEEDADLLDYEEYTPGDTATAYVASGGAGVAVGNDAPATTRGGLKVADVPAGGTHDLGTDGGLKVADAPAGGTRDLGTDGGLKVADAPAGGTRDLGTDGGLKVADAPAPMGGLKVADQAAGESLTATPIPASAIPTADASSSGTATEGGINVADSWTGSETSSPATDGGLKVADGPATDGGLKVADGPATDGGLKVADGPSSDTATSSNDVADEVAALRSMGGDSGGDGAAATPARGTVTAGNRSRTFDFGGAGLDWAAGVTKAQLMDALGDDPQVIGVFGNYLPSDHVFHSADEALNLIPVQAWQDAQGREWTGAEIPAGDEPSGYRDSLTGRMPSGDTTA